MFALLPAWSNKCFFGCGWSFFWPFGGLTELDTPVLMTSYLGIFILSFLLLKRQWASRVHFIGGVLLLSIVLSTLNYFIVPYFIPELIVRNNMYDSLEKFQSFLKNDLEKIKPGMSRDEINMLANGGLPALSQKIKTPSMKLKTYSDVLFLDTKNFIIFEKKIEAYKQAFEVTNGGQLAKDDAGDQAMNRLENGTLNETSVNTIGLQTDRDPEAFGLIRNYFSQNPDAVIKFDECEVVHALVACFKNDRLAFKAMAFYTENKFYLYEYVEIDKEMLRQLNTHPEYR